MAEMSVWVFTYRQLSGAKFWILSTVLISVTPRIALQWENKMLYKFLKFRIVTRPMRHFSTKSHPRFRQSVTLDVIVFIIYVLKYYESRLVYLFHDDERSFTK